MSTEVQFGASSTNIDYGTSAINRATRQIEGIKADTVSAVKNAAEVNNLLGATNVALSMYSQIQSGDAKSDYVDLVTSEEYATGTDTARAEMLETKISNMSDNTSIYQKAYKGYSAGAYSSAQAGRQKETITAKVNLSGAGYTGWMEADSGMPTLKPTSNRAAGLGAADYINSLIKADPILANSKVELGQAIMGEEYTKINADVMSARTPEELSAAIANSEDIKAGLKSPFLLNSTQAQAVAANNKRETQLQANVKLKQKEFKMQSKTNIAKAEATYDSDTVIGTDPILLEKDITNSTSDPLAAKHQYDTLKVKYDENVIRVNFLNNNIPGEKVNGVVPKEAKIAWQKEVTTAAIKAISTNDYAGFVNIVNFSPEESKEVGSSIYQGYLQAKSTKELSPLMNFLTVTSKKIGGATAISQSIGDKKYAEVLTTSYIANQMFEGDLVKARAFVQQQSQDVSATSIPFDEQDDILGYANDLGPGKDRYLTQMRLMYKISPSMAKDQYKDVAQYYSDQTSSTDLDRNTIVEDKSMNDFKTTSQALDWRKTQQGISDKFTAQTGFEAGTFTYLPNGQVLVTDKVTGFGKVIDGQAIADGVNDDIMEAKRVEAARQKELKRKRKAGEGSIADTIERLPKKLPGLSAPIKIATGLGKVAEKFGNYLVDQTIRDFGLIPQRDKDKVEAEIFKDEQATKELLDILDETIKTTPTTTTPPANNNMSITLRDTLKNAMENNKAVVAKAEKTQIKIEQTLSEILKVEQTGDTLTNIKTGKYGMTASRKKVLEKTYNKKLTDKEATTLYVKELTDIIETENSSLPEGTKDTLISTAYNMGGNIFKWSSFKKFLKNPTEENLQGAVLTKIYSEGKSVKGLAKRRAIDYNKSNPSELITHVEQMENGDIQYTGADGKVIFNVKSTKERHSKSKANKIAI